MVRAAQPLARGMDRLVTGSSHFDVAERAAHGLADRVADEIMRHKDM
jgi:hypothetical protein